MSYTVLPVAVVSVVDYVVCSYTVATSSSSIGSRLCSMFVHRTTSSSSIGSRLCSMFVHRIPVAVVSVVDYVVCSYTVAPVAVVSVVDYVVCRTP